jgi:hypothetical protein
MCASACAALIPLRRREGPAPTAIPRGPLWSVRALLSSALILATTTMVAVRDVGSGTRIQVGGQDSGEEAVAGTLQATVACLKVGAVLLRMFARDVSPWPYENVWEICPAGSYWESLWTIDLGALFATVAPRKRGRWTCEPDRSCRQPPLSECAWPAAWYRHDKILVRRFGRVSVVCG